MNGECSKVYVYDTEIQKSFKNMTILTDFQMVITLLYVIVVGFFICECVYNGMLYKKRIFKYNN